MDYPLLLDAGVVTRCRRRVHLEHDPAALDAPQAAADPAVEQRIADTSAHRRSVAAALARSRTAQDGTSQWTAVPGELPAAQRGAATTAALVETASTSTSARAAAAQRGAATTAALVEGAPFVWGGLLTDVSGSRRGSVELLVRHHGGYLPVLVVRHKVTDPGAGAQTSSLAQLVPSAASADPHRRVRPHPRDQLRLAHAVRMLRSAGLAAPGRATGGVIGLDADVVLWHDLDAPTWPGGRSAMGEYDVRFADRLAIAQSAVAGGEPLAQPSRVNECRSCPWWPTCGAALRAGRDVSMVLRGEDGTALRAAGVSTVDDLAALDPAGDPPVPLVGARLADAVVLARAWQRDLTLVRRNSLVAVPRADVEVDVDMESFGDSGAYLWGCLLTGADIGVPRGYRAFVTWEPVPTPDEARSFAAFWAWLHDVRSRAAARGLRFHAYCYNEQAENRWMLFSVERFAGAPGMPTTVQVQEFISSGDWVDLFEVVSTEFLCPHGKGLKTIAPAAGFSWHDPQASGENSMRWYRDAVGLDGGVPDPAQRERLLTYNADDVRATYALRCWMSSQRVCQVPLAGDL